MTTPNLKCSCCGCETWRTCDCGDVIDGEYHAAQQIAQQKRRGIWRTPGPWQTPWLYR